MDYQNAKLKRQDEFKADLANQQLALVFGPNVRRGPFGGLEIDPSSYQDLLRYNPNNFAQNYMTSAYLSAGSGTAES